MRFTQVIFVLAITLVLLSVCDATFNVKKAKQLAKITRTSALLKGNKKRIQKFIKVVERIRKKFPTCSANVCFALDGSGSINKTEWEFQKSLVELSIGSLGGLTGSKFAAVQYAAITSPIIPELSAASPKLLLAVRAARRQGGFTFIGPAIQWCTTKIVLSPAAVNKIILLGDGRSTFGNPGGFLGAIALAKNFRKRGKGYGTCGGLVQPRKPGKLTKNLKLFEDIVGDPKLVYREPEWADMITVVFALVELICNT